MSVNRRNFLLFLGAITGSVALKKCDRFIPTAQSALVPKNISALGFEPVKIPIPLKANSLSAARQKHDYRNYQVQDDLVLPPGFTYDVLATWGDRVGDSRFGYNRLFIFSRNCPQ